MQSPLSKTNYLLLVLKQRNLKGFNISNCINTCILIAQLTKMKELLHFIREIVVQSFLSLHYGNGINGQLKFCTGKILYFNSYI